MNILGKILKSEKVSKWVSRKLGATVGGLAFIHSLAAPTEFLQAVQMISGALVLIVYSLSQGFVDVKEKEMTAMERLEAFEFEKAKAVHNLTGDVSN